MGVFTIVLLTGGLYLFNNANFTSGGTTIVSGSTYPQVGGNSKITLLH